MPAKDLLAYAFSSRSISFSLPPDSLCFSSPLSPSDSLLFPPVSLHPLLLARLPSRAALLDNLVPLANVRSFECRRAAARRSPLLNARRRANLVIFYTPRFLLLRANWAAI